MEHVARFVEALHDRQHLTQGEAILVYLGLVDGVLPQQPDALVAIRVDHELCEGQLGGKILAVRGDQIAKDLLGLFVAVRDTQVPCQRIAVVVVLGKLGDEITQHGLRLLQALGTLQKRDLDLTQ